jgi:hypothetical protein
MIAHVRKVPASRRATAAASRLPFYGWERESAKVDSCWFSDGSLGILDEDYKGVRMFNSEIHQTDHEGKPMSVSPSLLDRVHQTDKVLHARLGSGSNFEYTGRWVFPEPGKAMLSLQVKIPDEQETFTFSLSPNTLSGDLEGYVGRAVQMVLDQANKTLQARIDRRLHNLLVSSSQGE